jgi:hypothetical protein
MVGRVFVPADVRLPGPANMGFVGGLSFHEKERVGFA